MTTQALGPPPTAARPSLWRNRDFLTFWSGETLSLFGAQITVLALPLTAVLTLDAQADQLGLLRFLQMVPYLLFGPLFGVWVDRHRRRTAMIGANTLRLALIGLIPLLAWFDRLDMVWLMVITFGVGVGAVLFDISWMSYVPTLIRDPEYLVEANSKLATTSATADAAGPGLAGSLVNLLTAPIAMAANAGTYLGSVVSLLLIRTEEPRPQVAPGRRIGAELMEGLRFVAGNRLVRWIAAVGGLANFFLSATQPMFILYAVRDQQVPASVLGLIFSVGACGGVVGGIVCRRLTQRMPLGRLYACALATAYIPMLLLPAAAGPDLLVESLFTIAWFLGPLGLTTVNILIISVRQNVTPPAFLGRMNAAVRAVMFGLGALGGLLGGLLASHVGAHRALWVSTAGSAVFVLCGVLLSPLSRLQEMPAPVAGSAPVPPVHPVPAEPAEPAEPAADGGADRA